MDRETGRMVQFLILCALIGAVVIGLIFGVRSCYCSSKGKEELAKGKAALAAGNHWEAEEWFQKAADHGNAEAMKKIPKTAKKHERRQGLLDWLIMEHVELTIGILVVSFIGGIALSMMGGWEVGVPLIAFGVFGLLIPAIIDLIIVIYSHFWTAVLGTIFISSFFTKSGQAFWKYALIFGAVYRASESIFNRRR